MVTDFKIARYANGSYKLLEFPDPHLDDGRSVVTIRATFRIDGRQKVFIHLRLTRQTLRSSEAGLESHLRKAAEHLAAHPERIPTGDTDVAALA